MILYVQTGAEACEFSVIPRVARSSDGVNAVTVFEWFGMQAVLILDRSTANRVTCELKRRTTAPAVEFAVR